MATTTPARGAREEDSVELLCELSLDDGQRVTVAGAFAVISAAVSAGWAQRGRVALPRPGTSPPLRLAARRILGVREVTRPAWQPTIATAPAAQDPPTDASDAPRRQPPSGDRVREAIGRLGGNASTAAIALEIGCDRASLRRPLEQLRTSGAITRTGATRSTRYHLADPPAGEQDPPPAATTTVGETATERAGATDDTANARSARPLAGLLDREQPQASAQAPDERAKLLCDTLAGFGVRASVIAQQHGPQVTRFELELAARTKVRTVATLTQDLAYALACERVRVLAPIPGRQAVGVELANAQRRRVRLGDLLASAPASVPPLNVWLGETLDGQAVSADLARMPHLLVAGTTGAGKSVTLNAMLCSILVCAPPQLVRLILVDTKQVEFAPYAGIAHLFAPVVTDAETATSVLENLVGEMEARYDTLSEAGVRDIDALNRAREPQDQEPLPYLLCVIDEFADLMAVAAEDVEETIVRLAQKARAVGIHLVLATQSPRAEVITGLIKANMPSRLALTVASMVDSRVILDRNGAEALLGSGDMLFAPTGCATPTRVQGALVTTDEVARITERLREDGEPQLREDLLHRAGEPRPAPTQASPTRRKRRKTQGAGTETGAARWAAVTADDAPAGAVAHQAAVGLARRALVAVEGTSMPEALATLREDDATDSATAAIEVLRARYVLVVLQRIEAGETTPALLDRFERLIGVESTVPEQAAGETTPSQG